MNNLVWIRISIENSLSISFSEWPSALVGYDGSKTITIENESYFAAEKNPESTTKGFVIELTADEVLKLDAYETDAYKKRAVTLVDGTKALVYLNKNSD